MVVCTTVYTGFFGVLVGFLDGKLLEVVKRFWPIFLLTDVLAVVKTPLSLVVSEGVLLDVTLVLVDKVVVTRLPTKLDLQINVEHIWSFSYKHVSFIKEHGKNL